jgi:cobyrinic acid a,c-diamide synthase
MEVDAPNPYFKTGQILHGHEFHYSYVLRMVEKDGVHFVFKMTRGQGLINGMDGICYRNVLATYSHMHALGAREWVDGIINAGVSRKAG